MHVEPSFVLYALLLDPGCCLRAHTVVEPVEPAEAKTKKTRLWGQVVFYPGPPRGELDPQKAGGMPQPAPKRAKQPAVKPAAASSSIPVAAGERVQQFKTLWTVMEFLSV